jgi:hypothetical protein
LTHYRLKQIKEEQMRITKYRETNGMKDAGMEIMRSSATGETKVVVQKWSKNVNQLTS